MTATDLLGNLISPYSAKSTLNMYQSGFAFTSVSPVIQTNTGANAYIYSGGITKDNTLGFSGIAMPGSMVSIYDGSLLLGVANTMGGAWNFNTRALQEGLHNFIFKATFAGQTFTTTMNATIDTVAPTGSFSSTLTTNTGTAPSIVSGDKTTDHTLGLSGTAETGSVVKIYDNGNFIGNAQLSGNAWSFDTQQLANGKHAFSTRISDQAGNETSINGAVADVYSIIPLGTLAPTIQTNSGGTPFIQNGGLTKDNTLRLSGSLQPGSMVDIYEGDVYLGHALNLGNSWSFNTRPLLDGTHNFQIKITRGSESTLLNASATIDTVAHGTFSNAIETDTGQSQLINSGERTTDHTLGLTGTAEVGSVVKIYDNNNYIGDAQVNGETWSFTTNSLANGSHSLTSKIIDLAKNTTTLTGAVVEVYTEVVQASHTWSDSSGWGSIDALAAINLATHQSLANIASDASTPWGINTANINDAWSYGYTGKGITIAVIDTGMSLKNTDLTQHLNKWSWDFVNNDNDVSDDNGHGTFVASEITSANNGVGLTGAAYDSELMVLKAMDSHGLGYATTIVQSMYYAVDHGANIISMSLAGGAYSGYADAISYAHDHNVLVVMAAGNDSNSNPSSPANNAKSYGNALAVGALQISGLDTLSMSSFSNLAGSGPYGYVDAAGEHVWGYGLDGTTQSWNGTSMATPYVAAEAALVWSANHALSADQLAQVITQSSHNVI
jgi:hypothetical protein